ncbi:hypothetical protein VTK73DRAFT_3484 [Phialemonium thermophilum]|uniref:Uncharacterized protein n=1 Tax=Phialemonium thermophilum TaxID=223376 RepID=A0ABR3VHR3_9PEZI
MDARAQRIAKLILHTLKSYPVMLLRHNTLPPFLHPSTIAIAASNADNAMEPLNNCMSLVHMISSGVRGSRKLFWKNVRLECERLCQENAASTKWGLLATMQALAIYILTRLEEGETDDNNLDALLLTTMSIMSRRFSSRELREVVRPASPSSQQSLEAVWQDWLLEESCRRLCMVCQIVNMLVYFEPAETCNQRPGLILEPLPGRKQLWEAPDAHAWKAETEKDPGALAAFALDRSGELVRLDKAQRRCRSSSGGDGGCQGASDVAPPHRSAPDWEEWCSGMDGFVETSVGAPTTMPAERSGVLPSVPCAPSVVSVASLLSLGTQPKPRVQLSWQDNYVSFGMSDPPGPQRVVRGGATTCSGAGGWWGFHAGRRVRNCSKRLDGSLDDDGAGAKMRSLESQGMVIPRALVDA